MILDTKCNVLKIILCYTTSFPLIILLTAAAVEFTIAPVVRESNFWVVLATAEAVELNSLLICL